MAKQTEEQKRARAKPRQKNKVAYTPLSEKEKAAKLRHLIDGLKSGKIKADLPADLGRGGRTMTIRDFGIND